MKSHAPAAALLLLLLPIAGAGAEPAPSAPLFATIEPDRPTVYQDELFALELSIYASGINLGKEIALSAMPAPAILHTSEFREMAAADKTIGERTYSVRRYRTTAWCPTPGDFPLAPTLQGRVVTFVRSFFFSQEDIRPIVIPVQPSALKVVPIPEAGKPPDFAGAIGQFSLDARATPTNVAVGDLITVTMIVTGTGRFDRVTCPRLPAAPEFKTYPPTAAPVEGDESRRVFLQTVVPQSTNATLIPPVEFAWFDTRPGTYRRLSRGPFAIGFHPEPTPPTSSGPASSSPGTGAADRAWPDLAPLKPLPSRWSRPGEPPWFRRPARLLVLVAIPAIVAGLAALPRRRRSRRSIPARPEAVTESLHRASLFAENGDARACYDALWQAMSAYFGACCDLPPGGVSWDAVRGCLKDRLPTDSVASLRRLFDTCERCRYGGPANGRSDAAAAAAALADTRRLLDECDRTLT